MTKQITADERRLMILKAAIELTNSGHHYQSITRIQVAQKMGMVPSHVHRMFDSMQGFKNAVVEYAIEIEDMNTIVQALCVHDRMVKHIDKGLKSRVRRAFMSA